MKFSSIEINNSDGSKNGINNCKFEALGNVVLLTGSNGSGKSRFLKTINQAVNDIRAGNRPNDVFIKTSFFSVDNDEEVLTIDNIDKVRIANYSHYDANLQTYKKFSPYVIHKAKEALKQYDYEQTALNSLLYISDLINGYSPEFKNETDYLRFVEFVRDNFDIQISKSDGEIYFFGHKIEEATLSPGQQYLLRIAVACFQNPSDERLVFFLDEPELHLHPKALIRTIDVLRNTFVDSQFWIATHSLALISYIAFRAKDSTIIFFDAGKPSLFRSDSEKLISGLMGSEENNIAFRTLMETPDYYASCKFATECCKEPITLPAKPKDSQIDIIMRDLSVGDIVIDYGAGKGRLIEGLGIDNRTLAEGIEYYAYDKVDRDAFRCKKMMNTYGSSENNYYFGDEITSLKQKINGRASFVYLVNVLHEISPDYWEEVFENSYDLLSESGKLVIVELEELKTGEAPYDGNFLMITENAARVIFGEVKIHKKLRPSIIKYEINKSYVKTTKNTILQGIRQINKDAHDKIAQIKEKISNSNTDFKTGIKLTFWMHQFANSSLISEKIENELRGKNEE